MLKMNKQTNKIKDETWDPVNEEFNIEKKKDFFLKVVKGISKVSSV